MKRNQLWYLGVVAIGVLMLASGCGRAAIRANLETPRQGPPGALACATLDSPRDAREIGTQGGRVSARGHTLIIPPGALERGEERRFSIVHPARDYVVVQLEPHGQPFDVPATLQLSYEHCEATDRPLAIYRWSPAQGWAKLESRHDRQRAMVEARLESLSSYALGAE